MTLYGPTDIFTPNNIPTKTYVERNNSQIEKQLKENLSIPNIAISISGPSKSGKTVLTRRVLNPDILIKINGASIKSEDDLWMQVLNWMDVPDSSSHTVESSSNLGATVSASGELAIPLVAKGATSGTASVESSKSDSKTKGFLRTGLPQVIKEIGDSEYVVFIDDFHYVDREIQTGLGKQIKAAIENGVKVCVASVPHRADDAVRSNPELRGRLASIDMGYWASDELVKIANLGFPCLNVEVSEAVVKKLAAESFGSPQLMQALCLNLCFVKNLTSKFLKMTPIDLEKEELEQVFQRTSSFSDWSSLIAEVHSGPRQRGLERKIFSFVDGTEGDVYRCVLLAISSDPPSLSMRYEDILGRVKNICTDDSPTGSSINAALEQISKLSKEINGGNAVIEWDEDILDFIEPYVLFYMRSSNELKKLGLIAVLGTSKPST